MSSLSRTSLSKAGDDVRPVVTEPKKTQEWVKPTMDPANKEAIERLAVGSKEFIDFVTTDQSTGRKLSYAEMRMRYG
jgi:hypothetical protein